MGLHAVNTCQPPSAPESPSAVPDVNIRCSGSFQALALWRTSVYKWQEKFTDPELAELGPNLAPLPAS